MSRDSSFCEIGQSGLIRFSGDDASAFLSNLLTCDVAALTNHRSSYGAHCTPKGRMLASFLLWRSEQGYFMQLPSSLREPIQKQLSKYILRSRVKAADVSADWTLIGVSGKDAAALVQSAAGQAPHEVREVAHTTDATVIRLSGDRFQIAATRASTPKIIESLVAGADRVEPDYWNWLEIHAGVPTITPATQEAFVPQMVNLDLIGGVSFEKGCYPGQEIVARMHYRGTLKQRMYLAHVAGPDMPQPGDKLYSAGFGDQACGTIVNAARSPEDGCDVLAAIQIAAVESQDVRWRAADGLPLAFLALPYKIS